MSGTDDILEQLGAAADTVGDVIMPGGATAALAVIVGPSVVEIGQVLKEFTGYRLRNLLGIGEKSAARLSDEDRAQERKIHPRVAKELIEEGSWIEDDVSQEYIAGLLVDAHRSDAANNDTVYLANLTARLGPSHLRLHHLIYSAYVGRALNHDLRVFHGAHDAMVNISQEEIVAAGVEDPWNHAAALSREELIGQYVAAGNDDVMRKHSRWCSRAGVLAAPTPFGLHLFLRAYSLPRLLPRDLRDVQLPAVKSPMPIASDPQFKPGALLQTT